MPHVDHDPTSATQSSPDFNPHHISHPDPNHGDTIVIDHSVTTPRNEGKAPVAGGEKQANTTASQPPPQQLVVQRIVNQTLYPPTTRIFSPPSAPLKQLFFDQHSQSIREMGEEKPLKPIVMQFSIHLCSKRFAQDVKIVFPALRPYDQIYAIPTYQPITTDMTSFTFEAGEFKDLMLDNTMTLLLEISQRLKKRGSELSLYPILSQPDSPNHLGSGGIGIGRGAQQGMENGGGELNLNNGQLPYVFDGVEPSTGLPYMTTSTSSVYSEVEGAGALLKYPSQQAGSCFLLYHPNYGLSCYPATFFIAGFPPKELYDIMMALSVGEKDGDWIGGR